MRAVIWTGLISHKQILDAGLADAEQVSAPRCAEMLINADLVPHDGILDAIDCHIEESFTDIFGWRNPKYEMIAEPKPDSWINTKLIRVRQSLLLACHGGLAASG